MRYCCDDCSEERTIQVCDPQITLIESITKLLHASNKRDREATRKKKNKVALSLDKEIIDLSRAINGLRNAAWKRNERTTSSQNSSFLLFKRPY